MKAFAESVFIYITFTIASDLIKARPVFRTIYPTHPTIWLGKWCAWCVKNRVPLKMLRKGDRHLFGVPDSASPHCNVIFCFKRQTAISYAEGGTGSGYFIGFWSGTPKKFADGGRQTIFSYRKLKFRTPKNHFIWNL